MLVNFSDPFWLIVALATLVVVAAGGYFLGHYRGWREGYAHGTEIPSAFKDELMDLRYIKEQLDNPPIHHEHVWARKPDVHKMGWLRYRCTYKDCLAYDWRAEKVPVA